MAGIHLQRVVQEIIGSAEADPLTAPQAYVQAAQNFRALAQQPQFRQMATLLGEKAQEFKIRAAQHLAVQEAVKDDFEEQEQHFAEAYSKFGHHGNDMLVKAGRNEAAAAPGGQQTGAAASDVQRVCPIPISVESQRIGSTGQFKYQPTQADTINGIKESDTLLMWQDVKSVAQVLTVDVGLIKGEVPTFPPKLTNFSCRPYGIVEYGADGYHSVVKFDVGCGTRFTVAGNYCSVQVGMDPPDVAFPPWYPTGSGIMSIGASLGFYAAPSQAPVTCTAYIDNLAQQKQANVVRPAKAVAILPPIGARADGSGPVPITLTFYGWGGEIIGMLSFNIGDIVCPIPLSNDIAGLQIGNDDSGGKPQTSSFRLVFQLAL